MAAMESMTVTTEAIAQHGALTQQRLDSALDIIEKLEAERVKDGKRFVNMAESRSAQGLKVLSGDKDTFKIWHDKLINVMGVTMGREWRNYMYLLSQKLDQDRKPLEVEELADI